MKFGKLESISQVNWQLGPDHSGNQKLFKKWNDISSSPKVFIGCTGWAMKEWIGIVYPNGTKAKDFLYYYSRQFNTIELNTTHYRIPTEATIKKWLNESGPGFKFCPKILQRISHSKDLGISGDLLNQFCVSLAGLEDKLGSCFMQLPPYFDTSRISILEQFVRQWPEELPLAIELRHPSWFSDSRLGNRFFDYLEEQNRSLVITDVAGRRDVLHQRLTNEKCIIRFVGNNLHSSDFSRIDDWVLRLSEWFQKGLKQVFFFTHEPDNLKAPDLAAYFVNSVNKKVGTTVAVPTLDGSPPLDVKGGNQIVLF